MFFPPPVADPSRRDRKRQETNDRIVAAAFELFERNGYEAVTMEQIAAAADVAKATLYAYFPVKEAIVRQRFHADLAAAAPAVQAELARLPTAVARLRRLLELAAAYDERQRGYLRPYLQFRLSSPLAPERERSGFERVFAALIADAQAQGEIAATPPAAQLAHYLQFLHLGALVRWLDAGGEADGRLAAEFSAMLDLFLHGVGGAER
ncbi:MAG TPA: TetR/AcrR family transcriptional regulator [Azospira sp.]|nr:TetR/AcrR family transcriptional regulator [Azospira sp.]